MTNAQAAAWSAFREAYNATGYAMPDDHRHSPAFVIGIGSFYNEREQDYETVVVRFHPDGRREGITDALSASHFASDARTEGRRI